MNFPRDRRWLVTGAIFGALAVAAGAFGAHGLEAGFAQDGSLSQADERLLGHWDTASRYQMYHALALLAVGFVAARQRQWCVPLAGGAFTLGTLLFSGCLYALVLSGQRWLGAVVPIGGVLLIVGWICLAVAACRAPS
jgi:uncharacterized membrane protein YgdD (TMEM256/DUF423 family)